MWALPYAHTLIGMLIQLFSVVKDASGININYRCVQWICMDSCWRVVFILTPQTYGCCRGCIPWSLLWRHNWCDGVSNHQPHDCLLNRLFRRRSKKTSKLRVTGFCAGNSPVTGEFPAQMASNAENVSIWWRHHGYWYQGDPFTNMVLTL